MKTFVFRTDAPRSLELSPKLVHWTVTGPRGPEIKSQLVLLAPVRTLGDMLTEIDDGTNERDIRDAIVAAALADDWMLADSLARQYGLVVCLRCASDMHHRPGWRVHRLVKDLQNCWGEVCGSCAVDILELNDDDSR